MPIPAANGSMDELILAGFLFVASAAPSFAIVKPSNKSVRKQPLDSSFFRYWRIGIIMQGIAHALQFRFSESPKIHGFAVILGFAGCMVILSGCLRLWKIQQAKSVR